MGIQTALDAVRDAPRIVDAMRLADDLAFEASREPGARTIRVLLSALAGDDQLVAIAAIHALAQVPDEQADAALSRLLGNEREFLREHAAWALSSRVPRADALAPLTRLVVDGGFAGMLAQRTLEQWTATAPLLVAAVLEGALLGVSGAPGAPGGVAARARLVETLGLVRDRVAGRVLVQLARDTAEHDDVRAAAVAALGQRSNERDAAVVLDELAASKGPLADVARLALIDLASAGRGSSRTMHAGDDRAVRPLTIAQLFLHADIDAGLTQAGAGDNGGIATLLVRLGDALAADAPVDRVVTLSRGTVRAAIESVADVSAGEHGHAFGRVPLGPPVASASAWPLRVTARRGIRRVLRAAHVDVLHLRMADVGSLAAADVARELDIPVVFTVAPDPHAVIQSLDLAGSLTRRTFGEVDAVDHFWFRTRLVQRLASNAEHTVLFPRPRLATDLRELVGIDIAAHPERHSVVPEGIDLGTVDAASREAAEVGAGAPATGAFAELAALLEQLPPSRRGLPLLVSVGRFHRVKGMAAIVEAWLRDGLDSRANLLLVGGDLDHPSDDEREQLDRIDALVPAALRAERGLVLPGHRPNDTVARWVSAARFGVPARRDDDDRAPLAAPRGVYVCGSVKEEFGIALLEAMAAGLLVVAPDGGGPATYVEQGATGFLTRTWDVAALGLAMRSALDAASAETDDSRAERSRATVEGSFTIQAMARDLGALYARVRDEEFAVRAAEAAVLG